MNPKWDIVSAVTCLLVLYCFAQLPIPARAKNVCWWVFFLALLVVFILYVFVTKLTVAVHS